MSARSVAIKDVRILDAGGRELEVLPVGGDQHLQVAPVGDTSPEGLLMKAIERGMSIDVIERLATMAREMRAERSRNAFYAAMKAFQEEMPVVKATKDGAKTKGDSTRAAYRYAPIDKIVQVAGPLLAKHGFSYRFDSKPAEKREDGNFWVTETCIATHISGHSEPTTVSVPLGMKTDIMSSSQHVVAASTFAKRYAFKGAFGIITGDADTDGGKSTIPKEHRKTDAEATTGATAGGSPSAAAKPAAAAHPEKQAVLISDDQLKRLWSIATNSGRNEKSIASWLKVKYKFESSRQITTDVYKDICDAIQAKGALKV